jgi:sugar lactone lactonase YvrE
MMRWRLLSVALMACVAGCGSMQHPGGTMSRQDEGNRDRSQLAKASQKGPQLPQVWNANGMPLDARLEVVATFEGPMQTGVTVSRGGRIFVNYPKWGDPVPFTVVELKHGQAVAYPNEEINRPQKIHGERFLVSVQSVVVDPKDRLWILDTGSEKFGPVTAGGAKLVGVDLKTDQVFKTIIFPSDVALENSYLNDVRFDLTRGSDGFAFITDSSQKGQNGIIVVDLGSGKSWRRLNGHPSVLPEANFKPMVEGKELAVRMPGQPPEPLTLGSDGIAISADGKQLYYCPLASTHLYSVSTDTLVDQSKSEQDVAGTVRDLGDRGFASDGLETDSRNRVYLTDYVHAAVMLRNPDGRMETLVRDPRLIWPDTLSLGRDGYLYLSVNQLDRQDRFQEGKDLRQKPYVLFRMKVDSKPVQLVK